MYAFLVCLFSSFVLPERLITATVVGAIICWLFAVLGMAMNRLPPCPACENHVDNQFGHFCPECGGELSLRRILGGAKCFSCGKVLGTGKRSYTIKRCTHCGVLLDELGV